MSIDASMGTMPMQNNAAVDKCRRYRERHKDQPEYIKRRREYGRRYRETRQCRLDKYHLREKYGITVEQYNKMSAIQNRLCLICNQPETAMRAGRVKNLSVDHNHETGRIRGLLCGKCNVAIGLAEEDIERLREAIAYLKNE